MTKAHNIGARFLALLIDGLLLGAIGFLAITKLADDIASYYILAFSFAVVQHAYFIVF